MVEPVRYGVMWDHPDLELRLLLALAEIAEKAALDGLGDAEVRRAVNYLAERWAIHGAGG